VTRVSWFNNFIETPKKLANFIDRLTSALEAKSLGFHRPHWPPTASQSNKTIRPAERNVIQMWMTKYLQVAYAEFCNGAQRVQFPPTLLGSSPLSGPMGPGCQKILGVKNARQTQH